MKKRFDQPCWSCKKWNKNCSWSRHFIPIKNWEAIKTYFKNDNFDSYKIINCPEYDMEIDDVRISIKDLANYFGKTRETIYRWIRQGKITNNDYEVVKKIIKEKKQYER